MAAWALGHFVLALPAASVAADSRAGNQRAASGRGESADEGTGETNRRIQARECVREKGRRVVLIRSPRVLNLKHETSVEGMYVTGAPISACYRPLLPPPCYAPP